MGSRADALTAEIEQARRDLASDLAELRRTATDRARRTAGVVAALVALYVAYRVVRAVLGRRGG